MKHTQGPWKYQVSGFNTNQIVSVDNESQVAAVAYGNDETSLPNAQLIATAPELLEALKEAQRMLKTAIRYFPKSIRDSDRFSLLNVLANSVNPAIAKAEGEKH